MTTGFEVVSVTPEQSNKNNNGSFKTLTLAKIYIDAFSKKVNYMQGAKSLVSRPIFQGIKDSTGKLTTSNINGFYDAFAVGERMEGEAVTFTTNHEYPIFDDAGNVTRTTNQYTVVVFKGEIAKDVANASLAQKDPMLCVLLQDSENPDTLVASKSTAQMEKAVANRALRLAEFEKS